MGAKANEIPNASVRIIPLMAADFMVNDAIQRRRFLAHAVALRICAPELPPFRASLWTRNLAERFDWIG